LERDRAAVLTVRSAVNGIIDYREADIMDYKWWRRWRILLNEMTTQSDRALIEHLYSYHLALVSNSGLTENSFKSVQESAKENFEELLNASRPWSKSTGRFDNVREELVQGWKEVWGEDLDDPKVMEAWKKDIGKLVKEVDEHKNRPESEIQDTPERRLEIARERVRERRARTFRKRNQ